MRTTSAVVTSVIGLCGLALTPGCGPTTYRMPDVGEQSATATLELRNGATAVDRIDGRPPRPPLTAKRFLTYGLGGHLLAVGRIRKVEMLPGTHELELSFGAKIEQGAGYARILSSTSPLLVKFTAEAGHTYRVDGTLIARGSLIFSPPADLILLHKMQPLVEPLHWTASVEDITDASPHTVSKPLTSKNAELTTSEERQP